MRALKIIGWAFFPYVTIFFQWKRLKGVPKVVACLWAAIALIAVISANHNKTATPATVTTTAVAKIDASQEVAKFAKAVDDKKNESQSIFDRAAQLLDTNDKNKAYDAMKVANEEADSVRKYFNEYSVDSGTPSDIKALLNKARVAYEDAYSTKADAYKAAMKYVDDGMKPSELDDIKQKLAVAASFFADAEKSINEVKQKAGGQA